MNNYLYSLCLLSVLTIIAYISDVKALPFRGIQCGVVSTTNRRGKILNGTVAEIMQIPWIASIKYKGAHNCGGSIISGRYIITAAHCFQGNGVNISELGPDDVLNNWAITLGEHSQQLNENFSANYRISRIIIHEDYRRETLKNDIALLELTEYIQWTDHIQPICLPQKNVKNVDNALAAGWGRDFLFDISVKDNKKLRYVNLDIFDNDNCNKMYKKKKLKMSIDDTQMCAGKYDEEIHDTTEGDSGGPLLVKFGERQVLVGVTSSGTKDTIYPKAPGIYTRVFSYLPWIKAHMNEVIYYPPVLSNILE